MAKFELVPEVFELVAARDLDGLIALLGRADVVGAHAAEGIVRLGADEAVPRLRAALKSKDRYVVAWATISLAELGDEGADERLVGFVRDFDFSQAPEALRWDVWEYAVAVLRDRKVEAAVEVLIDTLPIKNTDVRDAAADALAAIGDQRAVRPLSAILLEEDVSSIIPECYTIEGALEQLGGEEAERALAAWCVKERAWWSEPDSL